MSINSVKTLQGKSIDMGELAIKNDKTRAVGNMNPKIKRTKTNDSVATKTHKPGKGHRRQLSKMVEDAPVMNSKKAAIEFAKRYMERALLEEEGVEYTPVEPVELKVEVKAPSAPMVKPKAPKKIIAPTTKRESPVAPAAPVFAPVPEDVVSDELLQEVINKAKPGGGLAYAIAKAKEVKQEQMKTPREEQRNKTGVNRI